MSPKVFVSYRRDDNPLAWGLLRDRLGAEFGPDNVFFDQRSIAPGEDWRGVIEAELARAQLVVMVCGRQWVGPLPAGGPHARRIDDPDDLVRYELARAGQLGKRIEPFMIDAVGLPAREDLPPDLQHLHATNHRPYSAADSPLAQLDAWIGHLKASLHGRQRIRHYLAHALWTAWFAVSAVWLLAQTGALDGLRDVHDRLVQVLIAAAAPPALGWAAGETEVVVIDPDEHRELFGERTPLDAELVALLVDTLHDAARAGGGCDPARPIGLALELAPGEGQAGSPQHRQLTTALRRLAACRPVVLSCPQSIDTPDPPEADRRWLARLSAAADRDGAPVHLAGAALDAALLRPGLARTELGGVLGELRQGRSAPDPGCACAWRETDRQRCADTAWRPDPDGLLQPRVYRRRILVHALSHADTLMQASVVVIGGDFARNDRLASPIPLPGFAQALLPAQVHAFAADSAPTQALRLGDGWHYLLDLLLTTAVASAMMLLWRDIALHAHLYTRRTAAYATYLGLLGGLPLAFAVAAADWPALVPLAARAGFCVLAVGLRCGLAGYEVLIRRHEGWQPFALGQLWHAAARNDREGWSARIRLALLSAEAAVGCRALAQLV